MIRLIDKDALVAEIERRRNAALMRQQNLEAIGQETIANEMIAFELDRIISFINTLEVKKVEEMYERPTIKTEDDLSVKSRLQYIDDDLRSIANFILKYASWNLHKDEWNQPVLEVPLFRVLDALVQRGNPYREC